MPAYSAFREGPNGEWIRVPDDGAWGRVDYLIEGRAWPSDTEITLERLKSPHWADESPCQPRSRLAEHNLRSHRGDTPGVRGD